MSAPVMPLVTLSRADVSRAFVAPWLAFTFPVAPWIGPRLVGARFIATVTAAGIVETFEPVYAAGAS